MRRPDRAARFYWLVMAATFGTYAGACAAPAILGGPTRETTQQICDDGTICASWQQCPAPFMGGRCEAPSGLPPMQWGAAHAIDAGSPPAFR